MDFLKFPKIGKFQDALKEMRKNEMTEITYLITPKMHGTNAALAFKDGELQHCQSRNRILSVLRDNAGFAEFVTQHTEALEEAFKDEGEYYIFGEWIGPSTIKGAAVGALDQRYFVAFQKCKNNQWNPVDYIHSEDSQIRSVSEFFPKLEYSVKVDKRHEVYDELMEITKAITINCPVAYGLENVEHGVGEGLVGSTPGDNPGLWFKIVGDKHKNGKGSKTKLSDTDYEAITDADAFTLVFFDEGRLEQGLDYMREMLIEDSIKNTGEFIKWANKEFEEEGLKDYLEQGLEGKLAKRSISKRCGKWFTQRF